MPLTLEKIEQKAPGLLSLAKSANHSINKAGLNGTVAKVAIVLDNSGSMRPHYKSGSLQKFAEKILALGLNFDDDGAIDFFVFDTNAAYLGEISIDDYQGSVDRLKNGRDYGTTDYAGAFRAVRNHFFSPTIDKKNVFGKVKSVPNPNFGTGVPVYALFLTDGAPNSKPAAVKALTEISSDPVFWKFLSIGNEEMSFLQKLDDLKDRAVDNADYKHLGNDVDGFTDGELFDMLLEEYPEWLAEVRAKGILK